MKRNKGITLIALIITIVILIILTAITINSITSTNLFGLAKGAAENYIEAGKKEQEAINAIMSAAKELGDGGETGDEAGDESEPDPPPEESEKLSDLITSNNYGDHVDYPVELYNDGTTTDETPDYDWKIFYKGQDEEGNDRIFIIADDYVPNTGKPLADAISTGKANMTTNGTYNVYWASAPKFKTIDSTILTLFMATGYELTDSYDNSKCTSQLLDTSNWTSFLDKQDGTGYGQYAIGGPTLPMWCASWNANLENKETSDFAEITVGATSGYGYTVSSDSVADQTNLYMDGTTSSLTGDQKKQLESEYTLYFPHTSARDSCYGYCLASPSAYISSGSYLMYVYCGGGLSYIDRNSRSLGLRPIVCLQSDVSATYDEVNNVYHLTAN